MPENKGNKDFVISLSFIAMDNIQALLTALRYFFLKSDHMRKDAVLKKILLFMIIASIILGIRLSGLGDYLTFENLKQNLKQNLKSRLFRNFR